MVALVAVAGIVLVLAGTSMLYFFHDPATGNSIMLEQASPQRDKVLARLGLAMIVFGSVLQLAAVIAA